MNDAVIVKVYDELGFLAFSEPVLGDLRAVLNRACDILDTDDFEGVLLLDYGNGETNPFEVIA